MKQLSIKFSPKDKFLHEDYIVANSNKLAYKSIMEGPVLWGVPPYPNHLLLIGPKSSGKTYLAHLWANKNGKNFITDEYLQGSIIDDIDKWEEEKLLYHFNTMHEARQPLLLIINSHPCFKLPDLQSRIKSLRHVVLDKPDEEMISTLLVRYFSYKSLKVSATVIKYLEKHIERDFESLRSFIERLDDFSLDNGCNITIPLINKLLKA